VNEELKSYHTTLLRQKNPRDHHQYCHHQYCDHQYCKGRYWDIWSERWTNDKAIYDCEGWFIGWREDYSTDDDKGVFVEKECSSCEEKGGNVARDEIVDEECCYEKSCNVNGELSENKCRYWDIWSDKWTNDENPVDIILLMTIIYNGETLIP
nr:hypothetical protein [Tanacetum cinerariifolium]